MEDKESKTQEATAHKISKAVEQGNLPVSRETILLGAICAYTLIIFFAISPSIEKLSNLLQNIWQHSEDWRVNSAEDITHLLGTIFEQVFIFFVPIFIILISSSLSASALQNVPSFILKRIKPELKRISIKAGINRIYSKTGFIDFLKVFVKFIGAGVLVYLTIFKNNKVFMNAFMYNQVHLPLYIEQNIAHLLVAILCYMAVIAGFDLVWARIKWRYDLKMSHQEIKDEHKELEGDPLVKSRIRSVARSRSQKRMLQKVPQANVIITNPTHFSVALRYNPGQDIAPIVVAKGQDLIALKIREIATEYGIELVENVDLARSLYKKVEVDQAIPEEFYHAVAEIIRYINKQRK